MPNLRVEKSVNVIPYGLTIQLFSSCRARNNIYTVLALSAIFYSQRVNNLVIFPRQVALQNPNGYVKIVTNFDIKIGHIINFTATLQGLIN
jgi:hypothetical protein